MLVNTDLSTWHEGNNMHGAKSATHPILNAYLYSNGTRNYGWSQGSDIVIPCMKNIQTSSVSGWASSRWAGGKGQLCFPRASEERVIAVVQGMSARQTHPINNKYQEVIDTEHTYSTNRLRCVSFLRRLQMQRFILWRFVGAASQQYYLSFIEILLFFLFFLLIFYYLNVCIFSL